MIITDIIRPGATLYPFPEIHIMPETTGLTIEDTIKELNALYPNPIS